MGDVGAYWDNAVVERFLGSLKHEDYKTREEARQNIFEYIEVFYNRKRRHAFLNYMTSVEYEKRTWVFKPSILLGEPQNSKSEIHSEHRKFKLKKLNENTSQLSTSPLITDSFYSSPFYCP